MDLHEPAPELTYSFRPALTRKTQKWVLSKNALTGPGVSLDLSRVREAALIQIHTGDHRLIRFILASGRERVKLQIALNASNATPDADQRQFLSLVSETATHLSHRLPDLTYRMEEMGRTRMILFMIGLCILCLGLGLTGAAVLNLHDHILRLVLTLPFLAMTKILGAVVIWRNWPLRQPDEFPIATLPFLLWTMGGPRPEGISPDQTTPMS
ncbi:hypothetical protein [Pseudooceanicola algae]|uniref:Uncharacterized protein n=1 Tax=Pseudooceanicola algae TaxID=1537215 RepID=A0A418SEX1_9RHOB|nr:hypothetical protein [Pseudooceanicola algae]QPM89031.1 hypothetical protein PSAL_002400 [Pseudooceanicola algae]